MGPGAAVTILCRACGHPAQDGEECPARRQSLRDKKNYSPAFFPFHHGRELREEHWAVYHFTASWDAVRAMHEAEG